MAKQAKLVLLVDDDPDLLEANRMFLEHRGLRVVAAATASEARKVLETGKTPDVAVLDVMMETESAGFHLANDVHRRYPDLPIIILSGVNEKSGMPYRFEADPDWLPVARFLDKPVDPARLLKEILAVSGGGGEAAPQP